MITEKKRVAFLKHLRSVMCIWC